VEFNRQKTSEQKVDLYLTSPNFVVCQDSGGKSLEGCHLSENDILQLPKRARVLEAGGSRNFGLATRIHVLRPDIQVVVIDPTLGLAPERTDVLLSFDGDKTYYSFERRKPLSVKQIWTYSNYQRRRLAEIPAYLRVVIDIAPNIDLPPNSVDLLVDSKGPGMYLGEEDFVLYLESIAKVLSPDGEARIHPLGGWEGNCFGGDDKRYKEESWVKVMAKISQVAQLGLDKSRCFWEKGIGISIFKVR